MNDAGPRRILAVDFGDTRTGLAATDFTGSIETPLPALVGLDDTACIAELCALARERESELVVVGMPYNSDGSVGPRAQRTQAFVAQLQKTCPCPVRTVDERNTTDEAHELLRQGGLKAAQRKKLADSVAALVILRRARMG